MTPDNLTALCFGLAQFLVILSGASLIVGLRWLSGRLFLLGILAAVVAVYGRNWLP
jgi:hypothetical protein